MAVMTDKMTDPREAILNAAAERILHYGYNKTTMSEIAADCGMSAGNIYRFFPSKIDIAEAMTRKFSAETHQTYSAIVRDPNRSATQKMLDFFVFRMERTFRLFEKNPKLMELAEIMGRERPTILPRSAPRSGCSSKKSSKRAPRRASSLSRPA